MGNHDEASKVSHVSVSEEKFTMMFWRESSGHPLWSNIDDQDSIEGSSFKFHEINCMVNENKVQMNFDTEVLLVSLYCSLECLIH